MAKTLISGNLSLLLNNKTVGWSHNIVLNTSNHILSHVLRGNPSGLSYHIRGMYVEFQNGGQLITDLPDPLPENGMEYYRQLTNSPNRDYLRIALAVISPQYNESSPNQIELVCHAPITTNRGVGGLEFSETVGSRIYGGALVAMPTMGTATDDPEKDVLWSRGYLPTDKQLTASQSTQLGIAWKINLNTQ